MTVAQQMDRDQKLQDILSRFQQPTGDTSPQEYIQEIREFYTLHDHTERWILENVKRFKYVSHGRARVVYRDGDDTTLFF